MTDLLLSEEASCVTDVAVSPLLSKVHSIAMLQCADVRAWDRVARVLRAIADLEVEQIGTEQLSELPVGSLILCSEEQLDVVLSGPALGPVVVYTQRSDSSLARICQSHHRVNHIIGWCSFDSMPRLWELTWLIQSLQGRLSGRSISEAMNLSLQGQWSPSNCEERDAASVEIRSAAERIGVQARTAERLVDVAHELMMNALYDAPVDINGRFKYASDRSQQLNLNESERPTIRMTSNGLLAAIEVQDPFGSLKRARLFRSLAKGAQSNLRIDSSHGGAGLGLPRVYASSLALSVDVEPGVHTTVTSLVSLDLSPRQLRQAPTSIHYKGPC